MKYEKQRIVLRENLRVSILIFFLLLGSLSFMEAKIKVYPGKKEVFMSGELLSKFGKLDIGNFLTGTEFTKKNFPEFINIKGDDTLVALRLKHQAIIIDTLKMKILKKINLNGITDLYKLKGSNFFIAININEKIKQLSRHDSGAKNPSWIVPLTIADRFRITFGKSYKDILFPPHIKYVKKSKKIFITGITFKNKNIILNKILELNSENGQTISDRNFHYRRCVDEKHELLLNKETKVYEVVDFNDGKTLMKGQYSDNDIPINKKILEFIDYDRIVQNPYRNIFKLHWEFNPLLTNEGLIIVTRNFKSFLKTGMKSVQWLNVKKTGEKSILNPTPESGLDMALRNISTKKWPVVVPHLVYQSGFKKPQSNSFWVISRDGSMKQVNIPPPINEKINLNYGSGFADAWCHDENFLYYLYSSKQKVFKRVEKERKLFRIKIGETKAKEIFTYADKQIRSFIMGGENNFLLLSGKDSPRLVKVPEGREINRNEFSEKLGTSLYKEITMLTYFESWKKADNVRYLHKYIPRSDLPSHYKRFMYYNFRTKSIQYKRKGKLIYPFTLPTVWGHKEKFSNPIDIGLKPVWLKDDSAVYAGIHIHANRVLFYVPITRFKTRAKEFPIYVTYLNKKEAILTVLTNLQTINFYKLTRPVSLIP